MRVHRSASQIERDQPDRPYLATWRNRRATIAVRGCGVLMPPEHEKLIRVAVGCLPTRPQRGQTGNSTSIGAVIVGNHLGWSVRAARRRFLSKRSEVPVVLPAVDSKSHSSTLLASKRGIPVPATGSEKRWVPGDASERSPALCRTPPHAKRPSLAQGIAFPPEPRSRPALPGAR